MSFVSFTMFPSYRVDAAKAALAKSYSAAVRAATRAGQAAPAAPEVVVTREYVANKCSGCGETSAGHGGMKCLSCLRGSCRSFMACDVTLHAESPRVAGWEFVAVVEPLEGGNLVRRVPTAEVAEGELDAWRAVKLSCDHCSAARRRLETFVLREQGETGTRYKQVGRNCLSAFLGGVSPASVMAQIGWPTVVESAGSEGDGSSGGGRAPDVFDPVVFLTLVIGVVREDGWVSRGKARETDSKSTSDTALSMMPHVDKLNGDREKYRPAEGDRARAKEVLAWAAALDPASDYEGNLNLVAKQPAMSREHAGLLASAVTAHARKLGEDLRRKAPVGDSVESRHVGAVGERVQVDLVVERVVTLSSDFGPLHFVAMRDHQGSAFLWKSGADAAFDSAPGDQVRIRGTVKAHSEFRGEKQTELSRCNVVSRTTAEQAKKGAVDDEGARA